MKSTLRNKHSVKEVWIINLAQMLLVLTTFSKPSSVTASGDASSLRYLQNGIAETYFENETSAESTYLSSSPTDTMNYGNSFIHSSSTTEQTTPATESITTTHLNPSESNTVNGSSLTHSSSTTEQTTPATESITTTHLNPSESNTVNGSSLTHSSSTSEQIIETTESITTYHEPGTTSFEPTTNTSDPPPKRYGDLKVITGVVVGCCLLVVLLTVLFVNREPLTGYCNIGRQNGVRHPAPAVAPYVPQNQETSEPENSGTSATLSSIWREFRQLSRYNPDSTSNIAHLEENADGNRYRDTVPYDFNIVNLKSGNYVNASHIESNIIMTQDPIMAMDDDFWPMVWEHNVSIIVRLSNDGDDRALPIAVYIPRIRGVVGQLEVTIVSDTLLRTNYSRRIIRLNDVTSAVRNRGREIYHYHLGCWETNTLPPVRDFMVALQEIRRQKEISDRKGLTRTLVHCGSGSGRTGAFVAVWLLLDSVDAEETDISVLKTVMRLREQRAHVVNTLELYKFIYECVEYYISNVDIPPSDARGGRATATTNVAVGREHSPVTPQGTSCLPMNVETALGPPRGLSRGDGLVTKPEEESKDSSPPVSPFVLQAVASSRSLVGGSDDYITIEPQVDPSTTSGHTP